MLHQKSANTLNRSWPWLKLKADYSHKLVRGLSLIFIATQLAFLAFYASKAQQKETDSCSEEIFNVSQEMQHAYGLNVTQPWTEAVNDAETPYPGSNARLFGMLATFNNKNAYERKVALKTEDFMNSPGIQLRLATRVINACPLTSKVSFGIVNSGYWVWFFRMPSGKAKAGIPLDCGRAKNSNVGMPWGYFSLC